MKLRFLIIGFLSILLASCGSNKKVIVKVYKPKTKPRIVVKPRTNNDKKEEKPVVPKIKPIIHVGKPKSSKEYTMAYIERFAPIAVKEMHDYKIPASITLAQGVLESGSGRSPLAKRSNNHFGIKCHKGWNGKSVTHDDDKRGECFRKYKYPESSYEDHSKFLVNRKRYSGLFRLRMSDYKSWARGLKRAGYATDPAYPRKLVKIIEDFELYKYDRILPDGNKQVDSKVTNIDKEQIHIVQKGDTLYSLARKYGLSVQKLKRINGLTTNNLNINQELIIR